VDVDNRTEDIKCARSAMAPRAEVVSRSPNRTWQERQGSAFARVRSRSLARSETLETSGLSARLRTGANIARTCHAEGRGFESHHPLVYPAKRHPSMSLRTTDDLLHAVRRDSLRATFGLISRSFEPVARARRSRGSQSLESVALAERRARGVSAAPGISGFGVDRPARG
jgi:hypothetical protein